MEARLINRLDHVLTFSHKDVALLENLGVSTPIEVIEPLVRMPEATARPPKEPDRYLYRSAVQVGELRIDQVVSRRGVANRRDVRVPEAKLVIAGADPPEWLVGRRSATTVVTGYVEDLDAVYRDSSLFVAPLIAGAGVKFKVLDAMAFWAARGSDSHSGRRNSGRRGRELLRGDNRRPRSYGREDRVLPTAP